MKQAKGDSLADTERKTAIIADDHAIVRQSLAAILGEIGTVDVVAQAENGLENHRASQRA